MARVLSPCETGFHHCETYLHKKDEKPADQGPDKINSYFAVAYLIRQLHGERLVCRQFFHIIHRGCTSRGPYNISDSTSICSGWIRFQPRRGYGPHLFIGKCLECRQQESSK